MGKMNWGRIVFCGIVACVVWTVLSLLITATVGRDFAASVPGGSARLLHPDPGLATYMFLFSLVMGIWAMWLYAAIRPRYGPGPRTAIIAGVAWYVITTCVDGTWMGFGFVPMKAIFAPSAASLPALIIAALAGARLYRE
jgi:hypothetical protein